MSLKNSEAFKVFLEACVEEINLWGRCGGNLRPDSWNRVIQKLKESEFKIEIWQKNLKNLWDYNKKYKIWSDMVNKSGHGYNHETNTFDWPESIWEDYIKKVPEASKFKKSGLQYPELMRVLFDNTFATGEAAWAPMSDHPRPVDCVGESSNMEAINSANPESRDTETSNSSRKRARDSSGSLEDCIRDLILKMDGSYSCPSPKTCNETLMEMGLSKNDPHAMAVMCLFTEKKMVREQWMSIQGIDMEVKLEWIKKMAIKYGYWSK